MVKYFAIDGDEVGLKLENYIYQNQLDKATTLSKNINEFLASLQEIVSQNGGVVIFCGGDSILFKIDSIKIGLKKLLDKAEFCTFSAGLGNTPFEAHIALKAAKASGRNSIKDYNAIAKIWKRK